jgi:hypothetical protein
MDYILLRMKARPLWCIRKTVQAGQVLRAMDYVLYTSQEFDALQRAACDGEAARIT